MDEMLQAFDRQTDRRSNCINTIRLIAALQVAYGHITYHMGVTMPHWINVAFGYFQGVPIFFLLSGFLIWDSVERSNNYPGYLKKRFWRIYPELWLGILVEIVGIIIFYGIPNIKQFILFIVSQSTILQFWTPDFLRGYGCGTPNGSLWTICVLIQFYLLVWFIRKILHNRSYVVWGVVFLISILLGMIPELLSGYLPNIILKLYNQTVLNYLYLFLAGAFLAEYREKLIPFVTKYWYVLTATAIVLYTIGIDIPYTNYDIVKGILCVYGLIGFSYAFPKLNIKTDISYGLYIYHMTVVNVTITLGMTGKFLYMMFVIAVSAILALISTKTIGAWASKKKSTSVISIK